MEKVVTYQNYVQEILQSYLENGERQSNLQLICDTERNHFQLLSIGWQNELKRVMNIVAHLDIIDGKIWVQRDFTEPSITDQLIERGVPNCDIVLGFQPPYKRAYSEFAVH